MKILKIRHSPNKILRKKSANIQEITDVEIKLFEDMLCTMHHFSGIGLAAPQIGISHNLFVVDIGEGPIKLANPEIIKIKGKDKMEEGCLSVPETTVKIERPHEIVLSGLNEEGKTIEIKAKGLLARVIMHEIDHLNGKLIVDYMNIFSKIKYNLKKPKRS